MKPLDKTGKGFSFFHVDKSMKKGTDQLLVILLEQKLAGVRLFLPLDAVPLEISQPSSTVKAIKQEQQRLNMETKKEVETEILREKRKEPEQPQPPSRQATILIEDITSTGVIESEIPATEKDDKDEEMVDVVEEPKKKQVLLLLEPPSNGAYLQASKKRKIETEETKETTSTTPTPPLLLPSLSLPSPPFSLHISVIESYHLNESEEISSETQQQPPQQQNLLFSSGWITKKGDRKENQDFYTVSEERELPFWAVLDG
jgi:hypothetical protein